MTERQVRIIGRVLYTLWLRHPRLRDRIDARFSSFFGSRAADWDELTGALSPTKLAPLEAGLDQLAAEPRRAADVGTGTGAGALLLARRYPTAWIEGIDPAQEMLAIARSTANRLGVAVRYTGGSADRMPLKRDSTDLLTYVNAPIDFHEAARVLRPGGAMIACFTAGDQTPFYAPAKKLRRFAKRAGMVSGGGGKAGDGEYFCAFKPIRSTGGLPPGRPLLDARDEQHALIAHIPQAATNQDSTAAFERPAELLIARRRKFKPFAATSLEAVQKAAQQAAARGELSLAYGDRACAARAFLGAAGTGSLAAWLPDRPEPFADHIGLLEDLDACADLLAYGAARELGAIDLGANTLAFHFVATPISDDHGPRAEFQWESGGATLYGPFEAFSAHREPELPEGVLVRPLQNGGSRASFEPFVVRSASIRFRAAWVFNGDGEDLVQPPTQLTYRPNVVKIVAPIARYAD